MQRQWLICLEQIRPHKRSCLLWTCRLKHWYLEHCCLFAHHNAKGCLMFLIKARRHKLSVCLWTCLRHRYLQRSCFLSTESRCDASRTRRSVTNVHVLFEHTWNTGIYSILASLHNMLQQDVGCVWNKTCSHEHSGLSRTCQHAGNYGILLLITTCCTGLARACLCCHKHSCSFANMN